jgi:carbonic anhydrase
MQESLRLLRERGWRPYITEHNVRHGAIAYKQDLFGFADLLCLREAEVLAVQTTTRSNMNARIAKIAESEEVDFVRKSGIQIHVHGWVYRKKIKQLECVEVDVS